MPGFRTNAAFLFALTSALSAAATMKPFFLPWDDATPSITSLADWQSAPAGVEGWVSVNAAGHFEVAGERIRFLGVNITADDAFPSHETAEKVAARLAKFGINNVRFHHLEAPWIAASLLDYSSGTSRVISAEQLDRLHYFVSQLKQHGIYSNINLLVSRDFKVGDGFPAELAQLDWKDRQVLSFFDDHMVDLQKEYATNLLTAVNPYTGLSLAEDPAVCFVEILNENGTLQNWFNGLLDSMPTVFRDELNERWNTWLTSRYATTTDLLQAWGHRSVPLGPNKLDNGDFSAGTTGWNLAQHDTARRTATATNDFNGQPALKVQVTTAGSATWHVQINQGNKPVASGKLYTVSFWAKASRNVTMRAAVQRAHTDYTNLAPSMSVGLTTEWQQFSMTYESTVDESNARLNFGGFGNQLVTVWLADVHWHEGGEVGGLPEGVTLEAGNIPSIAYAAASGGSTTEARRDWVRFLLDRERDYWGTMYRHIKDALGYNGLVFGTIIANSPPNIQAALDVVDSHGYWRHPHFPNKPWDPVDWTVENVSMVNSPGEATVANLARQRVKGKPHTVTEYQHPAPNTYSAEAPLLAAAYGALQDWDGIWMFAYESDSADYITGFFDNAHHTTKMANMLLAAAMFRRFDIRPARKEYTMAFPPETEVETVEGSGSAWRVGDGSHLGVAAELALVSRLSLDVGEDATGLTAPPPAPGGNVFTSDTGELRWDNSRAGRGVVTVNTPRTKAVIGFIDGRSFDLDGVTITPGATEQDWCTIGLTMLDGDRLNHPAGGHALLVATGNIENTGMVWKNAQKDSVGDNWGSGPTLVEIVPATITLPVSVGRVHVYALDAQGNRAAEIPVSDAGGRAEFSITTDSDSLWYEIDIAPGPAEPPAIITQPASLTVEPGQPATLSVGVSGYPEPAITWYRDGNEVGSGVTLQIDNASEAQAGNYHAVVTNSAGQVTSRTVVLAVRALPSTTERLVNISTRGRVETGENVLIAGFVLEGAQSRELLVRAAGPRLADFGIQGALADPLLELFDQAAPASPWRTNDNWIATEVNDAIARTGAFAFSDDGSPTLDAAMAATFPAGAYTAQVSGVGGAQGVALVEVYDAGVASGANVRLANLSTRGLVGSGEDLLIAGFVVTGEVPMRLLIRGVGPTLAGFGVQGALEDPALSLFKDIPGAGSVLVATNDNWESANTDGSIRAAETATGAFALAPGSLDAALVVWLEPGAYTAQIAGHPGETGVALVEVYPVP